MAYLFITASKDATLYYQNPNKNTGLDEILEITKTYTNRRVNVNRSVIKFNTDDIENVFNSYDSTPDIIELIIKQTESREIAIDYTLYAYPISGSWEMGDGFFSNDITNTGVTWFDRNKNVKSWLDDDILDFNVEFNNLSNNTHTSGSGGVWYIEPYSFQNYSYSSADINMDIYDIVNEWVTGSIDNEGIILKFSNEFENDDSSYGSLKFYSKETNTIYQPKIRIGWDTQQYQTGSLSIVNPSEAKIDIKELKPKYRVNKIARFRLSVKDKYPLKTFDKPFPFIDEKYLPQTSYYQIKDFISNDIVIPFSEYSKINCDVQGNYIDIDFTNWESNRVYSFEFKVVVDDITTYFDKKITFNLIDN
jgi:hypothetical protein